MNNKFSKQSEKGRVTNTECACQIAWWQLWGGRDYKRQIECGIELKLRKIGNGYCDLKKQLAV